MFKKTKLIVKMMDRIQHLESTIDELRQQNLKLIQMIGELHQELAYLRNKVTGDRKKD
jgi:prefoldin subunit 5